MTQLRAILEENNIRGYFDYIKPKLTDLLFESVAVWNSSYEERETGKTKEREARKSKERENKKNQRKRNKKNQRKKYILNIISKADT